MRRSIVILGALGVVLLTTAALWLLAREPRLDATVQDHYLAAARLQGFDLSELIQTPHTGHPTA